MATYIKRKSKNGIVWRVEVARLGVRDSKTFDTKAEAVAWATEREADILRDRSRGVRPVKHTLRKAIGRYIEEVAPHKTGKRWEEIRLQLFLRVTPDLPEKLVGDITTDDIGKWRDARLGGKLLGRSGKPVAASSVNRELNLLSAVFEVARTEWKWIRENPMHGLRRPTNPPSRNRRISPEEQQAICAALNYVEGQVPTSMQHEVAIAFLVALDTGMRKSELLGLTKTTARFEERRAILPRTKNGDRREVPLPASAIERLKLLPGNDVGQLFRLTAATADVLFRRAVAKAELKDLHFHDTRHEACTQLAKCVDVLSLARIIGHRDLKSLMVYYNPTAEELADQLDGVAKAA
ncbi:tyrosine-type recombinase/integrase [Ralstonia nicotianae]|uniref:Site-specific integrase n=2 Tax=Ralstonia solanacearum species complex TaxID=3116862 RepID=A0A454TSS5_9RALS|nr:MULTISPECIES: site-specific integrase [Ralstonia solanacearum species complex]APC69285.1 site-specific integrase [Ralstonia solanacearum OE1-1]NKA08296.1 site-specific integrase [Ralstonia solanacearum]API73968.1 hypothetical protein AC251_05025 [Ralstonia pseudosolanacearum]MCK4133240.1 site-specific integrase [Ralstonia pseudosolanacearum]MDC6285049.1 site-specific integrase [Ralstonia pseudosolanacearum]